MIDSLRDRDSSGWARAVVLTALVGVVGLGSAAVARTAAVNADMDIRFGVHRVADLQVTPIDFGSILVNGRGGRVEMNSAGSISYSGGVLSVSGFSQAGSITLDADGVVATLSLDQQVSMGNGVAFVPVASSTSVHLTGSPRTVYIYGTIEIPAGTRTNDYRGVLNVSVTYN